MEKYGVFGTPRWAWQRRAVGVSSGFMAYVLKIGVERLELLRHHFLTQWLAVATDRERAKIERGNCIAERSVFTAAERNLQTRENLNKRLSLSPSAQSIEQGESPSPVPKYF